MTDVPARAHSDYLRAALVPDLRAQRLQQAMAELVHVRFDAIAVRGVSGLVFGSILADRMGRELLVIRRPTDPTHAHPYCSVEGLMGRFRYVIVDDLIATGATVVAILDLMHVNRPDAECAGIYLYHQRYREWNGVEHEAAHAYAGVRILNRLPIPGDPDPVPLSSPSAGPVPF